MGCTSSQARQRDCASSGSRPKAYGTDSPRRPQSARLHRRRSSQMLQNLPQNDADVARHLQEAEDRLLAKRIHIMQLLMASQESREREEVQMMLQHSLYSSLAEARRLRRMRTRLGIDEAGGDGQTSARGPQIDVTLLPTVAATGEDECQICLEETEVGEEFRKLPCNHLFHTRCIETWLNKTPCCPSCLLDLTKQNNNGTVTSAASASTTSVGGSASPASTSVISTTSSP